MSVRMGLLRKKPGWSLESFSSYWRDRHGPLAAQVPGLRGYWQNLVTERLQRGIDYPRGSWEFDGISQLWFDDTGHADAAMRASHVAASLVADEGRFLGGLHIVTAEQETVIQVNEQQRGKLLKRMSTLKRRPDIGEADFRREWRVHADHVRRMPGVAGYRQNVIVARELAKGHPCGYDDLPLDGIVELWFEDAPTLEAAFASPAGRVTMDHARCFLQEITAFLVEERRIV